MANFVYPTQDELKFFISLIQERNFRIKKYLPHINEEWYSLIGDSVRYVHETSIYEIDKSIHHVCARLLYKIAKRHELGDGNKRSAVICVYVFCILNDYMIISPEDLKLQAKRFAKTKGRANEEMMRNRVAEALESIIKPIPQE